MKNKPFLLVMLVCILALSFVFVGCKTDGDDGGGGGNVTSVKITGLDGKTGSVVLWIQNTKTTFFDKAEATISSNQVTFTFPTEYSGDPLRNGSYYLRIEVESVNYVYTNGTGSDGNSTNTDIENTAATTISLSGDVTIGFDKFKKN